MRPELFVIYFNYLDVNAGDIIPNQHIGNIVDNEGHKMMFINWYIGQNNGRRLENKKGGMYTMNGRTFVSSKEETDGQIDKSEGSI